VNKSAHAFFYEAYRATVEYNMTSVAPSEWLKVVKRMEVCFCQRTEGENFLRGDDLQTTRLILSPTCTYISPCCQFEKPNTDEGNALFSKWLLNFHSGYGNGCKTEGK
jgi:hypothetical protein